MFNQTFVDGVGKTNKSWTVTVSFLVQIGIIGVLVILPLIFTDVLPKAQLVSLLQAPAPPPPPPPPPPPTPVKVIKVPPRQFDAGKLMAPKAIPKDIAIIKEEELPPSVSSVAVIGVPGGVPGGTPSIGNLAGIAPPPPPPPPPPPKENKPVTVGGKVFEGRIVKRVPPDYPRVAKLARVQGAVRYTAVIGKDGKIRDLKYVSGPAMLATPEVMRAVSEWEYQPYLLNNEPVDVITEITVNFVLN
ncbi:MAG: TonB family protein [Bryobacterales bacterium]|nr:TonB family protein [Bryobacterales bacterium]